MKYRIGFVSNSSSSSFAISRLDITAEQLYQIINHEALASSFSMFCDTEDAWSIDDSAVDVITGSTWMDNFDMELFLNRIRIDNDKIQWGN